MKRIYLFVGLTALSAQSFAGDGLLGTKPGGESNFTQSMGSPVSGSAAIQLMVALGVVLLLVRYVLPKILTKVNHRIKPNLGGGIRVEESASFAGGNLYIVQARSKTLLLSVTGSGVTCLADITEPRSEINEPKTFNEILEEQPGDVVHTNLVVDSHEDPFAETLARLDRLDRLAK